ncbi:unnamed protein product, partial [Closterium sp. NIES-54]
LLNVLVKAIITGEGFSYKRDELLGDCFLKAVLNLHIFRELPGVHEGVLTQHRTDAISNEALLLIAKEMKLHLSDNIAEPLTDARRAAREKICKLSTALRKVSQQLVPLVGETLARGVGSYVEIGAFRTYPKGYKPPDEPPSEYQTIPLNKIEDFGVHCKQYYSLDITYFKSSLDSHLLDLLWNKYWVNTLSSSQLLANRDYVAGQISDLGKMGVCV